MPIQGIKVKPSFTSNRLAEQVANEELKKTDNFYTLRTSYLNLMHQLEIDGIQKHKISSVGQRIVIEKKKIIKKQQGASPDEIKKLNVSGWWYEVAKEENYTDQKFNHSTATQPELEIVPLTEIEKENSQYIDIIKNTIKFLKDVALPKLKENHFMSLLDDDSKVQLALHDWQAQLDISESFFDHKEKIPVNTQHILLHCLGTISSNNNAAEEYFRLREKAHQLTGKQLSKYRSGAIKTKLAIFNPKDRITAILWNYFGVLCNNCKSWRVLEQSQRQETTIVKCLDCNNIFNAASTTKCNYCSFPFFEEDISFIQKGGICPNCKEELPEYLINQIIN